MKGDVWVIEVKPVTDPLTRHGHKARDVDVRIALALKALLHGYGLRCTVIRDPQPADAIMAALCHPTTSSAEATGKLGAKALSIAKPSRT